VSFGRGIKASPEQNIKLVEEFAELLGAEIGITLPLSKKPYQLSQNMDSKYMIPDRVIGTSGSKVAPTLYVAIGLSGAVQHIAGMKDSEVVISINPDENSPIIDESDIFIKGRLEDVVPILIDQIKKQIAAIPLRSN
jgi:electron transfer flavoprotein alpha subunit